MDKDWAEDKAERIFSGLVTIWDWKKIKDETAEALRKVRREAIESCAVIAETTAYDGEVEIKDGIIYTQVITGCGPIAKAIRESEGNV